MTTAMLGGVKKDFESRIFEQLDDSSNFLVYGDWLQTNGDPRGLLVATQAALVNDPESVELQATQAELLDKHRAALLGPDLDIDPKPEVEWSLGFWKALTMDGYGWSEKPLAEEHVTTLLRHASARFLREITVRGKLSADVFDVIAGKHRSLQRLDFALDNMVIDDACLQRLEPCTELTRLHLFSCAEVTPDGLRTLQSFQRLQEIDLRNCPLTDAGTQHLEGLPLTSVWFNKVSTDFSAAGMQRLASLPLQTLDLGSGVIDDKRIAPLANHNELRDVKLTNAQISQLGAATIGSLSKLHRLNLHGSSLGDAGVRCLSPLAGSLQSLNLNHCKSLTDTACETIATMEKLTFLGVASNRGIGTAGLRMLGSLTNLQQLKLAFLKLSDRDIAELIPLEKLTHLSLAFSRGITDGVVGLLMQLPNLAVLDLAATGITTEAIDQLSRSTTLEVLGLYSCESEIMEHARTFENWSVNTCDCLDFYE